VVRVVWDPIFAGGVNPLTHKNVAFRQGMVEVEALQEGNIHQLALGRPELNLDVPQSAVPQLILQDL